MSENEEVSNAGPGDTGSTKSKPQVGDSRPAPPPSPTPGEGGVKKTGDSGSSLAPDHVERRPQIGDSRPAPANESDGQATGGHGGGGSESGKRRRRRRGGRGRGGGGQGNNQQNQRQGGGRSGGQPRSGNRPVEAVTDDAPVELDADTLKSRRGRERRGKPIGRYMMCVSVREGITQIAVLEGRQLIEHYLSRPADDVTEIHGNVYLAKVQNVLPGMEAAFVDIGTPKNAVLYQGDLQYNEADFEGKGRPRIEQVLKSRQTIVAQVTKNPIAHKGARLTQEVSLPGRFVVLVPNSSTYGISKRLPDSERKRLRNILDRVKPEQHGVIVRTAAENITKEEIERDVRRLLGQWEEIENLAGRSQAPNLLYREPEMAFRFIREEFNKDFRGVVIDDPDMFTRVRTYVESVNPALVDRISYHDPDKESLPLFERHHVHEQLRKALERKVWLPSGGSLIIEHTEALTVVDVNTGKNVGKSNLEETVFRNNLEAAEEIARQLRLRDIGGIIVIDFVDMEIRSNRESVATTLRDCLGRDKTRTQVFDISDLGLVEMTRKRIGEGLLESFANDCADCGGRGVGLDEDLLAGSGRAGRR
ncbi:MAG: Rne/Rng family ribonuclease [Acidimicrobiales bacterium]|nr:Rne/Rng family ribonuclease [Acidimicrobiales bacterium]